MLERIRADAPVSRRNYLRILVTVSGGLLAGGAGVAAGGVRRDGSGPAAPARVAPRLAPGEAVPFRYPGQDDRALAVRLPDGRLVGYSAVCTHLACAVLWRQEDGHLECPCHNGVFDPAHREVGPGPRRCPAPRGGAPGSPPATTGCSTRPPARWSPGRPRARCPRCCCARTP